MEDHQLVAVHRRDARHRTLRIAQRANFTHAAVFGSADLSPRHRPTTRTGNRTAGPCEQTPERPFGRPYEHLGHRLRTRPDHGIEVVGLVPLVGHRLDGPGLSAIGRRSITLNTGTRALPILVAPPVQRH